MAEEACQFRHPTRDLPCIRTGRHHAHAAEEKKRSPTHRATDVWLWTTEEP